MSPSWSAPPPASSGTLAIVAVGDSFTVYGRYVDTLVSLIEARQSLTVTSSRHAENGHSFDYAWPGSGNPNTLEDIAVAGADPLADPDTVLLVCAGTNGLVLGLHTPEEEADDAEAFLTNRIAAGFDAAKIYVLNMVPRNGYADWKRHRYNALLEAACVSLGVNFVHVASIPELQVYNSTILPDEVHPSDDVYDMMAEYVYDRIYPAHDWTPATIAAARSLTLAMWLDAADTTTMFTDAAKTTQAGATDLVYVWADKSGNGRDVIQATSGSRPSRSTLDTYPTISFPFKNLAATGLSGMPSVNMTFAMFAEVPTGNNSFFATSTDGSAATQAVRSSSQSIGLTGGFSSANGVAGPVERPATFAMSFPVGSCLLNGARSLNISGTPSAATVTAVRIGQGYGDGFNLNGKVSEIVFFGSTLNGVELQRLDRYLRNKRGLTDTDTDILAFTDSLAQPTSTVITSNTITVAGLSANTQVPLSNVAGSPVNGVQVKLNGASASSNAFMVENGDTIQLSWTTPASAGTENGAIFRLGNRFLIWRVTT